MQQLSFLNNPIIVVVDVALDVDWRLEETTTAFSTAGCSAWTTDLAAFVTEAAGGAIEVGVIWKIKFIGCIHNMFLLKYYLQKYFMAHVSFFKDIWIFDLNIF